MSVNRENIYAALFNLVKAAPSVVKSGRRLIHWADVATADMPALFVVQKTEVIEIRDGAPPRYKLEVDIVLYASTGSDESQAPSSILNPLVDYVTKVLNPDPAAGRQTLGGLVRYAQTTGSITTDEGLLGTIGFVIIPVEIMTERDWQVDPT